MQQFLGALLYPSDSKATGKRLNLNQPGDLHRQLRLMRESSMSKMANDDLTLMTEHSDIQSILPQERGKSLICLKSVPNLIASKPVDYEQKSLQKDLQSQQDPMNSFFVSLLGDDKKVPKRDSAPLTQKRRRRRLQRPARVLRDDSTVDSDIRSIDENRRMDGNNSEEVSAIRK
jgi:hypothetical protein